MEKSWSPCIAVGARTRHSYPLGEIILIGEGRGKAQHSHLCGGHCDSRDDQRHMEPPGTSNARDALPAIACRHAGKETTASSLPLSGFNPEEAHT